METPADRQNLKFQRWVAFLGIALFFGKLLAWYLTKSDAIFSDAMESIVNVIAAFMGLYSLRLAAKPKDQEHPYGHGKVEFVTSGIEGAMIIFAGVMILVEAVSSLLHGNHLQKLDWGIALIAATAVLNYILGWYSYKKGVATNSLVLQSSGKHLQSDTLTTAGVVLSLMVVYFTKIQWLDAAVALIFGGYIIYVGYTIVRKSLSGIMDEADLSLLAEIAEKLEKDRIPAWIDVHNVKIQQYGARLHFDGHITLPYYLELKDAHAEMENLMVTIAGYTPRVLDFNFHMDDCKPYSCPICQIKNCPVRQHPFTQRLTWTAETISQPHKHRLPQEVSPDKMQGNHS